MKPDATLLAVKPCIKTVVTAQTDTVNKMFRASATHMLDTVSALLETEDLSSVVVEVRQPTQEVSILGVHKVSSMLNTHIVALTATALLEQDRLGPREAK